MVRATKQLLEYMKSAPSSFEGTQRASECNSSKKKFKSSFKIATQVLIAQTQQKTSSLFREDKKEQTNEIFMYFWLLLIWIEGNFWLHWHIQGRINDNGQTILLFPHHSIIVCAYETKKAELTILFEHQKKKLFFCVHCDANSWKKDHGHPKIRDEKFLSTFHASKSFICNMHVKFPYLDFSLPSFFLVWSKKSHQKMLFLQSPQTVT